MHFELLVEDLSGKKLLDIVIPKIIGPQHTIRVHAYRGIGRIPKNMRDSSEANKRILLENLPRLLKGYGRTFAGYSTDYRAIVILVCDLDDKDLGGFRSELGVILDACNPKPDTRFCLAIEEGEAWLLGDLPAIKSAYPHANNSVLTSYTNDSICGTWEKLADAIYSGGSGALIKQGYQAVGAEKSRWAEQISPLMNVQENASPSFRSFRDEMRSAAMDT